jgi:hypothetical protein
MRGTKPCRRLYVVPKDPRTPGQLRARAALAAASKAWSHSPRLTEEQRETWRREGAKVQSRPRLWQSGPLTGQLHYVGQLCAKSQTAREGKAEDKRVKAEFASQVMPSQGVAQSTWEAHRRGNVGSPWQGGRHTGVRGKRKGKKACLQTPQAQRVARSTWEWFRSGSIAPRKQCRWSMGWGRNVEGRVQKAEWPVRGFRGLAEAGRKGRGRELWRGG